MSVISRLEPGLCAHCSAHVNTKHASMLMWMWGENWNENDVIVTSREQNQTSRCVKLVHVKLWNKVNRSYSESQNTPQAVKHKNTLLFPGGNSRVVFKKSAGKE